MTTPERIHASRLIEKIDKNRDYAEKIGLSYTESAGELDNRPKHEKCKTNERNIERNAKTWNMRS